MQERFDKKSERDRVLFVTENCHRQAHGIDVYGYKQDNPGIVDEKMFPVLKQIVYSTV